MGQVNETPTEREVSMVELASVVVKKSHNDVPRGTTRGLGDRSGRGR